MASFAHNQSELAGINRAIKDLRADAERAEGPIESDFLHNLATQYFDVVTMHDADVLDAALDKKTEENLEARLNAYLPLLRALSTASSLRTLYQKDLEHKYPRKDDRPQHAITSIAKFSNETNAIEYELGNYGDNAYKIAADLNTAFNRAADPLTRKIADAMKRHTIRNAKNMTLKTIAKKIVDTDKALIGHYNGVANTLIEGAKLELGYLGARAMSADQPLKSDRISHTGAAKIILGQAHMLANDAGRRLRRIQL